METLSRLVVTFLLNSLWQVTLLAGIATFCALLMRKTPAAYRHMLWIAALAASVLLSISGLQNRVRKQPAVLLQNSPAPTAHPIALVPLEPLGPIQDWAVEPHTSSIQDRLRRWSEPIALPRPWINGLAACYLLFLLYRLARLGRAWRRTVKIRSTSRARELPESLALVMARCETAFGFGDTRGHEQGSVLNGLRVAVLSSSQVAGPLTLGTLRPAIILPESFFQAVLSSEDMSAALSHEMAHVRRHDFLMNLVCELLCLPISFHPAAILIKRRIDETRELACDEMAAGRLVSASTYARALVNLARSITLSSSRALAGPGYTLSVFDANILEERVMQILANKSCRNPRRTRVLFAGALLTLLAVSAGIAASAFSLGIDEKKQKPQLTSALHANHGTQGQASAVFDKSSSSENRGPVASKATPHTRLVAVAQDAPEKGKVESDYDRRMLALNVVRLINTAELAYRRERGQYASWEELYSSTALEQARQTFTSRGNTTATLASGAEVIPGFELRLVTKPDGSGYNLSLKDIQDKNCGVSFFSDERGLIDQGKNIGCPEQSSATAGSASVSPPTTQSDQTGSISGEVVDASGARVPRAMVSAINEQTDRKQTTTANDAGEFSFSSLPPGRYRVEAVSVGFAVYRGKEFELGSGASARLQVILQPGSVMQSIVVTAKGTPQAIRVSDSAPKRIRVGGNVEAAKMIYAPKPQYPESARAKGIDGVVMLQAVIATDGVPLSLSVLSSPDPELSSAAMDAVRQWRYQPTLLNGVPVEVVTTIAVRFHLAP